MPHSPGDPGLVVSPEPVDIPGPSRYPGLSRAADFAKYTGNNLFVFRFIIFSISGFSEMRKTFPDTFQDFNFEILKSRHFWKMSNMPTKSYHFLLASGLPALCVWSQLPAALQRPHKNMPWIFGACILWICDVFVDFRVHQVVNISTTLHLYAYLCVLAPPWSYSISEIRNPAWAFCRWNVCAWASQDLGYFLRILGWGNR